jgi:hypothetical protein
MRIQARYLLDAVAALGEPVLDIVAGNQLSPVFFEKAGAETTPGAAPERFCIVMPLRIPKEV